MLKVATSFFLISICAREQVAQIRGKPIYKITDVALIPLSSQADADKAIASARSHVQRLNPGQIAEEEDSDSEDEDGGASVTDSLADDTTTVSSEVVDPVTGQKSPKGDSSVAEDVIQRKGVYGRFADKWFSKKGWSADSRRTQGLTSQENLAKNVESIPKDDGRPQSAPKQDALPSDDKEAPDKVHPEDIPKALEGQKDANTVALLPKILQTTRMYFSSGNFFFSYDYDLSHGIGEQQPNTSLQLFKQFDPLVNQIFNPYEYQLTATVFLESTYRFTIYRRRPTCVRSPYHPRVCWSKAVHHQDRQQQVEQRGHRPMCHA